MADRHADDIDTPETFVTVTALNLTFANICWLVFAMSVAQAVVAGVILVILKIAGVI